jgi:hypothetical protein
VPIERAGMSARGKRLTLITNISCVENSTYRILMYVHHGRKS